MTITIDLSPEIEAELMEAASQYGQDPATFARFAIEEKLHNLSSPITRDEGMPLEEALKEFIGVIQSRGGKGGSLLSVSAGEEFAEDLLKKHQEGRQ